MICHKWPERIKQQLQDKQFLEAMSEDERELFIAARHLTEDGRDSLLASGIKHAIVGACAYYAEGPTKVMARGAIHVNLGQETVPLEIEGAGPTVRREAVSYRKGKGFRHWPEYKKWSVQIEVSFLEGVVSVKHVKNLLDLAGFIVGMGDRRPAQRGRFGTFDVQQLGKPVFERSVVIGRKDLCVKRVVFKLIGRTPLINIYFRRMDTREEVPFTVPSKKKTVGLSRTSVIKPCVKRKLYLRLVGVTPLVVWRWSHSFKERLRAKS